MAKKITKKKEQIGLGIRALLNNIEQEAPERQEKVVKELAHSIAMVPVDEISENPNQPRVHFDKEALEELANSIKIHGLIQPVTVRRLNDHSYQLISGERRWRASQEAELKEIPAYIRLANDQEMLEMALVENIQRENLNPIEVALTYQRLKEECNLTDEKLAKRVGKGRVTVTHHLGLLKLPVDIQKAVRAKQISFGHARTLAGINDNLALQSSLFHQTLHEGLSVRALEKIIREYNEPAKSSKDKKKTQLPGDYQKVLDDFKAFFGSGSIQMKLKDPETGKGQLIIPFDKVDELNALWDKIEDL